MAAAGKRKKDEPEFSDTFEIWVENEPALQLFFECENLWSIIAGFGVVAYTNIDRSQLESVMNMLGIPQNRRADLLRDIKYLELGALKVLNVKD